MHVDLAINESERSPDLIDSYLDRVRGKNGTTYEEHRITVLVHDDRAEWPVRA